MNIDQKISVDRYYSWENLEKANLVIGETPVVLTYVYDGRCLFSKAGWFHSKKMANSYPYDDVVTVWDFAFDHYTASQNLFLELAVLAVEQLPEILELIDGGEAVAHLFTHAELNQPELRSLNDDFQKWKRLGMPKREIKRGK